MTRFIKENWFKLTIAVAVLIIAISVGYFFVFSLGYTNPIALQTTCAEQASKAYRSEGFGTAATEDSTSYINHYNQKLNKCFIETFDMSSSVFSIFLVDANELKEYASFYNFNNANNGAKNPQCSVDEQLSSSSYDCNSRADFDNYVKTYMEN